ncbi:MAG: serine hydrolase, partial [Oscillospiraceae bacterium]|nr:serine hydrolase [Oscillospiraceae bacterium]
CIDQADMGAWFYANINYGLLGAEAERLTGRYFQEYVRDTLTAPMGLDCGFDSAVINDNSDYADLYRYDVGLGLGAEDQAKPRPRVSIGENYRDWPGAFKCTSIELAEIVTVLINDGEYEGQKYLSREAVELMETPVISVSKDVPGVVFEQCLGLRRGEAFGRTVYYHNGNAYGVASLLVYDKQQRCGAVIITSGTELTRTADTRGMYAACYAAAARIFEEIG